jgi:hypothetical protein
VRPYLLFDFVANVWILFEELLGIFAPLPDFIIVVGIPSPAFDDNIASGG